MFNVVKIISSGANVPEICRMPTSSSVNYQVGSALVITSGRLQNATATSMPTYIAAESAEAGEKSTLACYAITPNMIFEVPVSGTPSLSKIGTKVQLGISDGFATSVTLTTTDGVATIVDTRDATKSGEKILVKFI